MYCLWNGEYGEHDLSFVPGLDGVLRVQEEQYEHYVGCVVGDFTCLKVDYDWGRRDQRWTIKCNFCGEVTYQYHTKDWRRGKGRKLTCDCKKMREKERKEAERKAKAEKIEKNKKEHLGKTYGEWKVVEYNGNVSCKVFCTTCGKKKNARIEDVLSGNIIPCQHRSARKYCGDELIGKKEGHLTTIGRDGSMFLAVCDCGAVVRVRPTDLFTSKRVTTCNSPNCIFASEQQKEARKKHEIGFKYEDEIEAKLRNQGYDAKKTKRVGDFGVDVIVDDGNGQRIAIQCKKQTGPTGVSAVQEVYAGGRYYDCTKFAVICETGFSNNAIVLAKKLGVYLCEGDLDYPENIQDYCVSLLPVIVSKPSAQKRKEYELDGVRHTLAEWCAIYGKSEPIIRRILARNIPLEMALKNDIHLSTRTQYTAFGVTGSFKYVCEKNGAVPGTVSNRMKRHGMTIEEAISAPRMAMGRPKKSN